MSGSQCLLASARQAANETNKRVGTLPMRSEISSVSEFFVGPEEHPMYVQHWIAKSSASTKDTVRPFPLIMIHGGVHTGCCWTTTPDGKPGWAPYLAYHGWDVYVVDWPGVGRSGFAPDFLIMGTAPIVEALEALAIRLGAVGLIGHSMGASLAFRFADEQPQLVKALLAINSGPIGNIEFPYPLQPIDIPFISPRAFTDQCLAYSDRFPKDAIDVYQRSLVPTSPSVFNRLGNKGESGLEISDSDSLRGIPILFVSAEDDRVAPNSMTIESAAWLGAPHLFLGSDWGLKGFGHMSIIEEGNLEIAARASAWLISSTST